MNTTHLSMTFQDEAGKSARLQVREVKDGLSADEVKAAAKTLIDAGVFRAKGKLIAVKKAEIVTTASTVLFSE